MMSDLDEVELPDLFVTEWDNELLSFVPACTTHKSIPDLSYPEYNTEHEVVFPLDSKEEVKDPSVSTRLPFAFAAPLWPCNECKKGVMCTTCMVKEVWTETELEAIWCIEKTEMLAMEYHQQWNINGNPEESRRVYHSFSVLRALRKWDESMIFTRLCARRSLAFSVWEKARKSLIPKFFPDLQFSFFRYPKIRSVEAHQTIDPDSSKQTEFWISLQHDLVKPYEEISIPSPSPSSPSSPSPPSSPLF